MNTPQVSPEVIKLFRAGEHITGKPGRALIQQSGLLEIKSPPDEPLVVFDNACGTGVIAKLLFEMLEGDLAKRMKIVCGDIQPAMLDDIRGVVAKNNWQNVQVDIIDAMNTKLPDESFTHIFCNFGLMSMGDPDTAIKEMYRLLRPGGVCAISNFSTLGWLPYLRRAVEVIPGCPAVPDNDTFLKTHQKGAEYHKSRYLESRMEEFGFQDVSVTAVDAANTMESADILVQTFNGIISLLLRSFWTAEELENYVPKIGPAILNLLNEEYGVGQRIPLGMAAINGIGRKE